MNTETRQETRTRTETRDGFIYETTVGDVTKTATVTDSDDGVVLGTVSPTGSRFASQRWAWRAADGVRGHSSSRTEAAMAMFYRKAS